MKEKTRTASSLGRESEYSPIALVAVPKDVPCTIIFTPGMVSPVSASVTVPETTMSCTGRTAFALTENAPNTKNAQRKTGDLRFKHLLISVHPPIITANWVSLFFILSVFSGSKRQFIEKAYFMVSPRHFNFRFDSQWMFFMLIFLNPPIHR